MKLVVDTNVAVVANGVNVHAGPTCQIRCIEFLQGLATGAHKNSVVLDESGLILQEYRTRLNHSGQPGVGDLFYKFLHDHMYLSDRVHAVRITMSEDESCGFAELPNNFLDPSDRKFLAAAVASGADIVNATDGDWNEQKDLLESLIVTVRQLCPEHACT